MSMKRIAMSFCLTVMVITPAIADFIVYPGKGQSDEQMEKDKFECQRWATNQTGFDPLATPRASTPPPAAEKPVGGAGRGAVAGGAGGALIGALTGNTKKGALIGAGSGALLGGMRRSSQQSREQAAVDNWEQQEVARITRERDEFNRAYKACLTGRGYTVM
jgi:hypothetical protein